jgi:16S rRNA (guanine527-N7)-methyltransferase
MHTARIAALLAPFLEQPLALSQLDQISIYIDLLQRWNVRINLTAIRNEEEIVTRHFGESLFMARHLFPALQKDVSAARTLPSANTDRAQLPAIPESKLPSPPEQKRLNLDSQPQVLDIGSGAGFPAIPLKIWAPQIRLTLIEANHKKATFLREVSRVLTLTDINVITDRAEVAAKNPNVPRAKIVTLRAVEHFETILPQATAFLAHQATLALLIGAAQLPKLTVLTTLSWNPPINIPQSQSRVLSLGIN